MVLTDKHRIHRRSAEAQAYRRWYGITAWHQARKVQFAKQPPCERCKAIGRITPATVVNHRQPGAWPTSVCEVCWTPWPSLQW